MQGVNPPPRAITREKEEMKKREKQTAGNLGQSMCSNWGGSLPYKSPLPMEAGPLM